MNINIFLQNKTTILYGIILFCNILYFFILYCIIYYIIYLVKLYNIILC